MTLPFTPCPLSLLLTRSTEKISTAIFKLLTESTAIFPSYYSEEAIRYNEGSGVIHPIPSECAGVGGAVELDEEVEGREVTVLSNSITSTEGVEGDGGRMRGGDGGRRGRRGGTVSGVEVEVNPRGGAMTEGGEGGEQRMEGSGVNEDATDAPTEEEEEEKAHNNQGHDGGEGEGRTTVPGLGLSAGGRGGGIGRRLDGGLTDNNTGEKSEGKDLKVGEGGEEEEGRG